MVTVMKNIRAAEDYLHKLGIPMHINPADVEMQTDIQQSDCYYDRITGLILVDSRISATAHELYHKYFTEQFLTGNELSLLNKIRRPLVNKIRSNIKRQTVATQKNIDELKKKSKMHGKYPEFEKNEYISLCDESCMGYHYIEDKKLGVFGEVYLPCLSYENKQFQINPRIATEVGSFHFSKIYNNAEKFFLAKIGSDYRGRAPKHSDLEETLNNDLVSAINKLDTITDSKRLRNNSGSIDEVPAHFIQLYLEQPNLFNKPYTKLYHALSNNIGSSCNSNRDTDYCEQLAEEMIDRFESLEAEEPRVEARIAECIQPEYVMSLLTIPA